ncbi:MAG: carboxypeptidase-like regulatory domain-containing protein [Spirochaetia bacterium]|nr:carboxypeptidase-like regulatory domain-containing protein [Spirochaetia bacterium]
MKNLEKIMMMIFILLLITSMNNCTSTTTDDETIEDAQNTISGIVSKGPINGGTVSVYKLNENASRGELLGTTVSAADGSYSIATQYEGAIEVVVTGGTYSDEATGQTITLQAGYEMKAFIAQVSTQTKASVTALTTIAAENAYAYAYANTNSLSLAISDANAKVATAFGLEGTDITEVEPTDLTSAEAKGNTFQHAEKYGAVLAALSQYAEDTGQSAEDVPALIAIMAEDFQDGVFDNKNAQGLAIESTIALTAEECIPNMNTYMNSFMGSTENKSGFSVKNMNDFNNSL